MTKGRIWNPSHTSPAHNSAIDTCADDTFKVCLHPSITEALETDMVLTDTSTAVALFYSLWSLLSEMSLLFVAESDSSYFSARQLSSGAKILLEQPDVVPHHILLLLVQLF